MNIDELEKLARAATPGPWEYQDMTQTVYGNSVGGCQLKMSMHKVADIRGWGHYQYLPNGEEVQDGTGKYIAAASPDVVTALIDRVRELERALDNAVYLEPKLLRIANISNARAALNKE